MSSTSERLDHLEAENAALKAEVDRLKGKVEPAPKPALPIVWDGIVGRPLTGEVAMVRTIPDPPPSDMTPENLRELRRLVGKAYPLLISLSSAPTEQETLRRFGNAIVAAENFHMTDHLDTEHSLAWWVGQARSIVDHNDGHADFDGHDFTAAVLALSVWHREWTTGSAPGFGLMVFVPYGSGRWNIPLKGMWRETLRRGAIMPAIVASRAPERSSLFTRRFGDSTNRTENSHGHGQ